MNILELFKEWDPEIHSHAINEKHLGYEYKVEHHNLTVSGEKYDNEYCFLCSDFLDNWVLVKKKIEREGWVNIYPNNIVGGKIYGTEEKANDNHGHSRVACIKINWEE